MKIPGDILRNFEKEMEGMQFGEVKLTVFFNAKAGKPRFLITREVSLLSGENEDSGAKDKKRKKA